MSHFSVGESQAACVQVPGRQAVEKTTRGTNRAGILGSLSKTTLHFSIYIYWVELRRACSVNGSGWDKIRSATRFVLTASSASPKFA